MAVYAVMLLGPTINIPTLEFELTLAHMTSLGLVSSSIGTAEAVCRLDGGTGGNLVAISDLIVNC